MVFIKRINISRFPDLKFLRTPCSKLLVPCSRTLQTSCGGLNTNRPSGSGKPVIGVLGAGISGLSAAYYISKMYGGKVGVVVFEESDRVGGWMRTVPNKVGGFFEMGPRTIRPAGVRGLNTLDLVEEIGLDTEVLFVEKSHEVAKSRFIYVNKRLVELPSDFSVLYKRKEPFSRPLVWAMFRDVFARRKTLPDDSIYNFMHRRFGPEVANYLTDPLIRGILAGDSKKISIKFMMKSLFEMEQQHGSVVVGMLKERFSKKKTCTLSPDDKSIGFSKIAASSLMGNWAVWGLENGLGSLPERLSNRITEMGGQVKFGCRVERLVGGDGGVTVEFVGGGGVDTLDCDHVVSSVGSNVLGRILKKSKRVCGDGVVEGLNRIEYADLQVSGVRLKPGVLDVKGFGFLVPSLETSVPGLLGVVFDTNCFPQGGDTVVTVMSRGEGGKCQEVGEILTYLNKCLGVDEAAVEEVYTRVMKSCIPQYGVGHYEVVGKVLDGVSGNLSVIGNWVDGVSVNDCVYGGRGVTMKVGGVVLKEKCENENVRVKAASSL